MPKKVKCIKVPKRQGQKTLEISNKLELVDKEFEIKKDDDSLYIPLVDQPLDENLKTFRKEGVSLEITTCSFNEKRKKKASLVDLLGEQLPPHLLVSMPHAMDIVGDIAIIEIPPELEKHKNIIGEAVLESNKNIRTVLAKAGAITGTYRLREFNFIAGEQKTETVHKEHGCQYQVDVAKAYFSPRLSQERKRVASLVQEGETVADLFAGVGPFAILIAKTHENVKVYAIDANPYAVKYLKTNIRLNRVIGKVHPLLGDAKHMVDARVSGVADRVIMNLPEKAIEFVDVASHALKPKGGIVHFYGFVDASNSLEDMKLHFEEAVEKSRRKVDEVLSQKTVRETAPHEWQAVLDVHIH
jgi:tRNA (guanine37-N1)-methyltransferase